MNISRRLKYALAASVFLHLILLPLLPGPGEVEIPEMESEIIRLSLEPLEQVTPPAEEASPREVEEHPPEEEAAPEAEEIVAEEPETEAPEEEPAPDRTAESPPAEEDPEPEAVRDDSPGEQPEAEEEEPLLRRGRVGAGTTSERNETGSGGSLRGFDTRPQRYAVTESERPEQQEEFDLQFYEPESEEIPPEDVQVEFATGPDSEISPEIPYSDVHRPAHSSAVRSPISQPLPQMPGWLEEEGERVKVTVSYDVNREGYLENLTIRSSSGYRAVDAAVLEALRKWRYEPGEPLANRVTVFRFVLSP